MGPESTTEFYDVPIEICQDLMQYLRENGSLFRRVNLNEEPPLRKLSHGLAGECLEVVQGQQPPHPHMIKSDKLSKDGVDRYFHQYRFDQKVCEEAVHATQELRDLFGPGDDGADHTFRQVLAYASGPSTLLRSTDSPLLEKLISSLSSLLSPSVLQVYGAQPENCPQSSASMFSFYANLFLPGQLIEMHLDVPEFRGVDRSKCPNWLLVAAHCSGLFAEKRVNNVTCVLYPSPCPGGALAAYWGGCEEGAVIPVQGGNGVALDAESRFHHSERVRQTGSQDKAPASPSLPDDCTLISEKSETGGEVWIVVGPQGERLMQVPEEELRFSVSAKFHVFRDEQERQVFNSSAELLSPEKIIEVLVGDMVARGVLPPGPPPPLHDLAPLLVQEYVLPLAPTSPQVHKLWTEQQTGA